MGTTFSLSLAGEGMLWLASLTTNMASFPIYNISSSIDTVTVNISSVHKVLSLSVPSFLLLKKKPWVTWKNAEALKNDSPDRSIIKNNKKGRVNCNNKLSKRLKSHWVVKKKLPETDLTHWKSTFKCNIEWILIGQMFRQEWSVKGIIIHNYDHKLWCCIDSTTYHGLCRYFCIMLVAEHVSSKMKTIRYQGFNKFPFKWLLAILPSFISVNLTQMSSSLTWPHWSSYHQVASDSSKKNGSQDCIWFLHIQVK